MLEHIKQTVFDVLASKYRIIALLVVPAAIFALRGELLVTVALLVIVAPIYVFKISSPALNRSRSLNIAQPVRRPSKV